IRELGRATEQCGSGGDGSLLAGAPGVEGVFHTRLTAAPGGDGRSAFCERLGQHLALARLQQAFVDLTPAVRGTASLPATARLVDQALAADLAARPRTVALFVRGTVALARGRYEAARSDLASALAGELPASLRPQAHNNLGVALTRLGRLEAAREAFRSAGGPGRATEAILNLGILLDDHVGEPQQALGRYREYVAAGGRRRSEVGAWIERLERIYR
ncbi:MAG: tetratricopeptide repeat protein, partial [Acidobacteriota bacterium]